MWKKALIGGLGACLSSYFIYKSYINQIKLPPEATMSFEDYCISRGYSLQTHWVTTSDGYILRMYRLSKDGLFKADRTPVLMVHGLTHNCISYVISQTSTAPAFKLADNGYDVWLLNTRGNFLSRYHKELKPSQAKYWEWCSNHIALYDLPASIDFILEETKKGKINYVGHSQGGFVALHCLAYRPEYGDKINVAALLAPPGGIITAHASYMKEMLSKSFLKKLEDSGCRCIADFSHSPNYLARMAAAFPRLAKRWYKDRYDVTLMGEDPKVLSVYFQQFMGGTSLMNLKYLAQIIERKSLVPYSYDYGEEGNLKIYGSKEPPYINYSNIRCKLAVFYGKYDSICTQDDGKNLVSHLPPEKLIFSKLDYEVDHSGFAVSPNQAHMDKILELFNEHEQA